MMIDEVDATSSLETALSVAPGFGMAANEARAIAAQVGSAVARWRQVAA
jgi:hypothetical protein